MIFIGGIHGVGKTFFCERAQDQLGIKSYEASKLIMERKQAGFPASKLIPDIDENQRYLLDAIGELKAREKEFLLNGHFCLLMGAERLPEYPKTHLLPCARTQLLF